MIIYLDSSGLVKRYVAETDSEQFVGVWESQEMLSISAVGYAEVMAACGRRRRDGDMPEGAYESLVATFKKDWRCMEVIAVSTHLNDIIDRLTYHYVLRGFDSIHLASAMEMRNISGEEVLFVSADNRLRAAAGEEGLSVFPKVQP